MTMHFEIETIKACVFLLMALGVSTGVVMTVEFLALLMTISEWRKTRARIKKHHDCPDDVVITDSDNSSYICPECGCCAESGGQATDT